MMWWAYYQKCWTCHGEGVIIGRDPLSDKMLVPCPQCKERQGTRDAATGGCEMSQTPTTPKDEALKDAT